MPNKFSQRQLIIISAVVLLLVIVGVVIFLNLRPTANPADAVKLTVWGTEDKASFAQLLQGYPYGTVTYVQVAPANYEAQLLPALAAGTGPDIFEIASRAVPRWRALMAPMPAAFASSFGRLQLQGAFPDVVAQDFMAGTSTIYGLPLSVDTLTMVYNKDIFNSAGIALPPTTWNELDADVAALRTLNPQGQLTRAAAAIGGSAASIPNAPDLLSLLMLQNGTQMMSEDRTRAVFANQSNGAPGPAAFNFYLQFANAASPYYTWNDGMGNALDSFVAGKTAILFAYQSDLAAIRAKAPFLNIGVAPMPQAQGASVAINYPRYSGFVAARAGQVTAAWNFILWLALTPANAQAYQAATGQPPALRTQIQLDKNDPALSVFASQALTARSWYQADDVKINGIFSAAIQNVLNGAATAAKALDEAQAAVTALINAHP